MSVDDAGAFDRCTLGRWILANRDKDERSFIKLDRVHREFHRLAGQIVADCAKGQRDLARRTLAGIRFRKTSRDVVIALIDCFQSGTDAKLGAAAQ